MPLAISCFAKSSSGLNALINKENDTLVLDSFLLCSLFDKGIEFTEERAALL